MCYPPHPADEELEALRAVDPRVRVSVRTYEKPHGARTARGPDDAEEPAEPPVDEGLAAALSGAEVVLALDLPTQTARLAPSLRWVQTFGAGVEHLRGVELPSGAMLTNAAGVSGVSIAEFVLARLLALWKRLPELGDLQAARRWEPTFGRLVSGSTLVVVGLGGIGSALATRAAALGMKVLGVRRHPAPHPACEEVAGPDRLFELLARADAAALCAPATSETEALFDAEAFAAMHTGSIFCNVSRGSLVDEHALVAALSSGHLGAAVLDVTRQEPLPPESPLWDTPHLYLSPHSSVAVDRYVPDVFAFFADNLARYVRGEALRNVVDRVRGY